MSRNGTGGGGAPRGGAGGNRGGGGARSPFGGGAGSAFAAVTPTPRPRLFRIEPSGGAAASAGAGASARVPMWQRMSSPVAPLPSFGPVMVADEPGPAPSVPLLDGAPEIPAGVYAGAMFDAPGQFPIEYGGEDLLDSTPFEDGEEVIVLTNPSGGHYFYRRASLNQWWGGKTILTIPATGETIATDGAAGQDDGMKAGFTIYKATVRLLEEGEVSGPVATGVRGGRGPAVKPNERKRTRRSSKRRSSRRRQRR